MAIRVLVVEDDPMAQQLFVMFVGQSKRYELVQAINNADMADLYCENSHVDLILMDIRTSMYANGLDAAERIKEKYPKIKIIIVTSMPEQSYLDRARKIGVDSFWYKEVTQEPFYRLMDRTMDGEHIFPDTAPPIVIGAATSQELTEREIQVLRELITGATNLVIAERLGVTERTVKAHIQHILEKTGYQNRTELAVKASESGFVATNE